MENLIPVRVSKITANDNTRVLYIPKEAEEILGFEKGDRVVVYVDGEGKSLIVRKRIEQMNREEE